MSVLSRPRVFAAARALPAAFAIAVLFVAGIASAAEPPAPAATVEATPAAPSTPSTGTRIRRDAPQDLDKVLVVGAVNDPQDAAVPEDTTVPELPMTTDVAHR